MLYSTEQLVSIAVTVLLVMFSAIVHEVAHGWVAYRLGDPTAKEAGRLTLDPRAHLDGFGSVLLPLIMAFLGGPVFAFARPVPYNPYRLRHPRRDELLVALAGPASNVLQALVGTALLGAFWSLAPGAYASGTLSLELVGGTLDLLTTYVYVNLVLCFFNLIPFPPLDGSKVVLFFLKGDARRKFYELSQYAMVGLILILYVLPTVLGFDPLGIYLNATAGRFYDALVTLATGV
ncbi:site-2 protease family protein [Thermophilibacter provencensis]|uniref:Site-2 protease family protein n=1 Tax=Thermophilibacter provencensis TaxID=1852386 RepID=A0ABT7V390_9ACTN|nr:site-2 protease family protein [Thermophilibacter provencensis]MDM8270971.1 site-2 protease family protein [Thermophilibacter provencensis]